MDDCEPSFLFSLKNEKEMSQNIFKKIIWHPFCPPRNWLGLYSSSVYSRIARLICLPQVWREAEKKKWAVQRALPVFSEKRVCSQYFFSACSSLLVRTLRRWGTKRENNNSVGIVDITYTKAIKRSSALIIDSAVKKFFFFVSNFKFEYPPDFCVIRHVRFNPWVIFFLFLNSAPSKGTRGRCPGYSDRTCVSSIVIGSIEFLFLFPVLWKKLVGECQLCSRYQNKDSNLGPTHIFKRRPTSS